MLFLSLVCFSLALLGVFWVVRAFATKDDTPTERADLDKAGGIIFTRATFLPEPGLAPDSGTVIAAERV